LRILAVVVISEGDTPETTLRTGLGLFEKNSERIPEMGTILILIDCQLPQGHPATVNPNTLGTLISILKERGVKRILVLPGVLDRFSSKKTMNFLGLTDWIRGKGAELVDYNSLYQVPIQEDQSTRKDQDTTEPNFPKSISSSPLIESIDQILLLSQIRTDPIFGLRTSLPLLNYLISPEKRERSNLTNLSDSPINTNNYSFLQSWIQTVFKILSEKKPILIINDGFLVLEGNDPFIWGQFQPKRCNRMIISSDCVLADWITFSEFECDSSKNPFLHKAMEMKMVPKNPEIFRTNLDSQPMKLRIPEENLEQIKIQGLRMYLGKLTPDLKYSLHQFLNQLQTLFYKDAFNIGNWAIIAGVNPPEPECTGKEFFIVFGDSTISSTIDYHFRTVLKNSLKEPIEILGFKLGVTDILEGDALEREIMSQQAKIRRKREKKRSKNELLLKQIKNIEDNLYRERKNLENQMKTQLSPNFQY